MKHTKKLFVVLLSALMLLSCIPFAASAANEPTDWIEIYTYEDLDDVRYDLTANYKLMNDIDMTEWVKPGGDYDYYGQGWNPIGSKDIYADDAFTGVFDGNGHTISGLRMNVTKFPLGTGGDVFFGLFARVSGTVRNLTVAGSITVSDSKNNYAGGITAFLNETGLIENCTNRVKLSVSGSGYQYVGGIAGRGYGTVKNCRNVASVYAYASDSSYYSYAAGIVGIGSTDAPYPGNSTSTLKAKIFNCVNAGDITAKGVYAYRAAASGIANYAKEVKNCYNIAAINSSYYSIYTGSSSGSYNIFFRNGIAHKSNVYNCYNTGLVPEFIYTGNSTVYYNNYNYAITSFSSTNCFYLKGSGITSTGAVEKTAAQLKRQIQFTGWDFDTVWTMEGRDDYFYPELRDVALLTPDDLKTPIAGVLTIDGEAAADATLTVNRSGLTPTAATVSYSWKVDGTQVSTAKTYKVKTEDLGKTLVLTVTGTGDYKGELSLTRVLGEAHQHTEETIPGTPATCTQSGLTDGKKCSECGEILLPQEVIPATDHVSATTGAYPATCLVDGFTGVTYCTVCNEVLNAGEAIPAKGAHTPGDAEETVLKAAACGVDGTRLVTVKCSACGETLSTETAVIPATEEHKAGAAQETVLSEATCGKAGAKLVTVKCTDCGKTLSESTQTIPATGNHTQGAAEETVFAQATCGQNGIKLVTVKCAVCGEALSNTTETIDATGAHTPGAAVTTVVKEATCTAAGEKKVTVKCTTCGVTLSESSEPIPALKHQYTKAVTAPTCTAKGYTTYTCTHGDSVYIADYVDALGHTAPDKNGNCTRCHTHLQDVTQPDQPAQSDDEQEQKSGDCKYCGETHEGFGGFFVGLIHSILALFGLKK